MKKWVKTQISKAVRFAAREFADELGITPEAPQNPTAPVREPEPPAREVAAASEEGRVRIDAADLVGQLGSGKLNQSLIHLYTWNHRWMALLGERNRRNAATTYDFIDGEMPDAVFTASQFRVIESKRDEMYALRGHVLDLGVHKGGSTRSLARVFPEETIHGFDSFEGLPEDWSHVLKGDFGDLGGVLPDMPDNVRLHKGWFDETLPKWVAEYTERPISVLRVDCDIYSSTKTIFDVLGSRLEPGSWIVFDELIGYRGWEQHEYKAFLEFIERTGFDYSFVAYGLTYAIVRLGDR